VLNAVLLLAFDPLRATGRYPKSATRNALAAWLLLVEWRTAATVDRRIFAALMSVCRRLELAFGSPPTM